MKNNLFRKSSIDRISSPEELNDYIKVSNPSVWVVLIAVIILLISVLIWGVFGSLDTGINANGTAAGNEVVCYLSDVKAVSEGMKVKAGDTEGAVISVSKIPISKEDGYEVKIQTKKEMDGTIEVFIITSTIHPISFLLN